MSAPAGFVPARVPEDLGGPRDRIHDRAEGRGSSALQGAARRRSRCPRPNAFLRIGEDDTVTVLLAHSEMGQGIWTTLPMMVAEELELRLESKIRVETAPAAPVYAHTAYGVQMTGGSTTTWSELDRYRQVGAMAREMLVAAAAAQWKVKPADCRVEKGFVVAGARRASYGSLAKAAQASKPPAAVKLKDRKDWKILGKPTKRLDSPQKVTGQAQFGIDVQLPGMKTALVARAPVFGGKVKGFRAEKAKAVPGVRAVVEVPSGVAVVADHFWAAKLGRDALEVDWDLGAGATLDTAAMGAEYRALAAKDGLKAAAAGDVEPALAAAKKTVEAEYDLPFLAHATMEPLNCAVQIEPDACEIWTGTQFQTGDQGDGREDHGLEARAGPDPHDVPRRRLRPAREPDERLRAPRPCTSRRPPACRSRSSGRARTTCAAATTGRCGCTGSRSGSARTAMPAAWQPAIVGQSILDGTPFADDDQGGHRRDLRGGRRRLAVPRGDAEPLRGPPLAEVPGAGPLVAVGRAHPHGVRHGDDGRRARGRGRAGAPPTYRRALLREVAAAPRRPGARRGEGRRAAPPPGRFRGLAVHESFESYVAAGRRGLGRRAARSASTASSARSTAASASTPPASRRRWSRPSCSASRPRSTARSP